jgi:type II secretory pathway component GspD/PulD (secretin)
MYGAGFRAIFVAAALTVAATGSVGGDPRPYVDDPATLVAGEPVPAPVTLSARDTDIRDLLQLFSRSRKLNIVTSDDVEGRISIELHDVPFHEALRAVVGMAGFQVIRRGEIYFIGSPPAGDDAVSVLRDVRTYRLDYALTNEIAPVLEPMLSSVGKITAYPPLRTLIVEDLPDVLLRMDRVLDDLDGPPRQVLIEAKILEINLTNDVSYGIDWSLIFSSGSSSGTIDVTGFAAPATPLGEGLFVGYTSGDFNARIEALEGVTGLQTLASPRLLAIDGIPAEIIVGDQLGFSVVTTVNQTVIQSVQFLDTGAQLRITPTITADGFILMTIHPELSDGKVDQGVPSKTTAQVTTDALVRDGQTLFVGGLIRERDEEIRRGIPGLMRIPILGRLFGKTSKTTRRSELVTLITPHIMEPGQDAPVAHMPEMERKLDR